MGNAINIPELQKLIDDHRTEFETYSHLLIKWNKVHNLTAITNLDEIWEKHFLDSITPLPFLSETGTLLDIGSGAGFPGIPLKIMRPTLPVTLLEATQKKCNFCEKVIQELGLTNIRVVHGRAEDKKIISSAGKFDCVISRATFSLKSFIEISAPYLRDKNSIAIAMKGQDIKCELEEAKEFIIKNHFYTLPKTNSTRQIIVI